MHAFIFLWNFFHKFIQTRPRARPRHHCTLALEVSGHVLVHGGNGSVGFRLESGVHGKTQARSASPLIFFGPGRLSSWFFLAEEIKGFLCLHTSYTFVQAVGNAAARRATSRHDRTSSVPGHLMMIPRWLGSTWCQQKSNTFFFPENVKQHVPTLLMHSIQIHAARYSRYWYRYMGITLLQMTLIAPPDSKSSVDLSDSCLDR